MIFFMISTKKRKFQADLSESFIIIGFFGGKIQNTLEKIRAELYNIITNEREDIR